MAIRKEIVGSLVPVLFGAGFLLYDTQYPLDNWANPGPAVFPFLVGSVLVVLSVWQLVRAGRKPKPERSKAKIPSVKEFLQSNKGKMKALLMIAVFIVYLLMVQWVGFFVSNFLFVVTSSRLMKARDWRGPLSLSLGVNLFCYLLFEVWLKLSFPRGILF
jgi:putative tricarboxylic transport membrane protein